MKRSLSLSALSLAAVVVLAGCGSETGPASDPPAPSGETAPAAQSETEAPAEHNAADVMFAQMMIPHHRQAVQMSEIMLGMDGVDPDIADLAARIQAAQAPEIEAMTGWLESWGEPVEPEQEDHHMGSSDSMNGMMTEDQMDQLEAAEGEEAATMFLEFMIAHHTGAVTMAESEIANGENTEAIALARAIVKTQQAEIQEMEELLAQL